MQQEYGGDTEVMLAYTQTVQRISMSVVHHLLSMFDRDVLMSPPLSGIDIKNHRV